MYNHSQKFLLRIQPVMFPCLFFGGGKPPGWEQRIYDVFHRWHTLSHNMFLYWLIIVPYVAIPFGSGEFWPRMSIPTGGVFVTSTATTFGANARTDRPKYIQQEWRASRGAAGIERKMQGVREVGRNFWVLKMLPEHLWCVWRLLLCWLSSRFDMGPL